MFRITIFLLSFISATVCNANSLSIAEILRRDLATLDAKHADGIAVDTVLDSQTDMRRVFHELNKHGALAGKIIAQSADAQQKIKQIYGQMKQYGWQKKQMVAALNVIGLTHDAIYHTDGSVRPCAQVAIKKLMHAHDGGLRFAPAAHEYITYKLLQHLNKYNRNLPYAQQIGIKLPSNNVYGIFQKGALMPRAGTGENELFSALLAEDLLRRAGVSIEWQLVIVAGILNTVPFISPSYQEHFAGAVRQVSASFYIGSLPAKDLAAASIKIINIFTNYFDIANYRDGSLLTAYNKIFTLEQRPELQKMLHSGKDDWLLISVIALDNNFHQRILKPKLMAGQAVIFHGTGQDDVLNKKAIAAIDYETLFIKIRAVGAFLKAAEEQNLDVDNLAANIFIASAGYAVKKPAAPIVEQITHDLESYANLIPATDAKFVIQQGYISDALVANLIKQYGILAIIKAADFLEHKIAAEKSILGKKHILGNIIKTSWHS